MRSRAIGQLAATVLAGSAAAGCTADSTTLESLVVVPGYYETLDCRDLLGALRAATDRVKELTTLMEKSASEPGGSVVNALAYDTEFAKSRAAKKYAEAAAVQKGCDVTGPVDAKVTGPANVGSSRPQSTTDPSALSAAR